MARVWDRTPAFTADAGQFTFGADFTTDVPINVQGVLWWQTEDGPDEVTAYLWAAEGSSQLATGAKSDLTLGWNLIPFDEPYAASPGLYAFSVEIDAEHGYNLDGLPKTSPDGHVTLTQGRFESGHVGYPAASTWLGLHGIDVEYELAAQAATGALDGSLPSLTAQLAGSVTAAATIAGALPAMAVSLTGKLTASGALSGSLPGLSAQLAGIVIAETVRGDLDATLPALTGTLRQGRAMVARPDTGTVARP